MLRLRTQECLAETDLERYIRNLWIKRDEALYAAIEDTTGERNPEFEFDIVEAVSGISGMDESKRVITDVVLRHLDRWLAEKDERTGKTRRELLYG